MDDKCRYRRDAPRPVELHLAAATLAAMAAMRGAEGADAVLERLERARALLDDSQKGLSLYRRHPWRRPPSSRPVFWRRGTTRLLDYGGAGPPVVVVPSLINRAYILDLAPTGSLLRWLAARGMRVLLLDWGEPGAEELAFSLEDYALHRVIPALEAASRAGAVRAVGYCMGGTLLIGALSARPGLALRAATLGAPWRFAATPFAAPLKQRAASLRTTLASMQTLFGAVPAEIIQALFAARDITVTEAKLRRLARLPQDSPEAIATVALQEWLNDGVPLPAATAIDCLEHWFVEDRPVRGEWRVGGRIASADATGAPLLVIAARRDPVCPPGSTEPLAGNAANATTLVVDTGHIGMVTRGARNRIRAPLADFLTA